MAGRGRSFVEVAEHDDVLPVGDQPVGDAADFGGLPGSSGSAAAGPLKWLTSTCSTVPPGAWNS